jgi:hypothetical protein
VIELILYRYFPLAGFGLFGLVIGIAVTATVILSAGLNGITPTLAWIAGTIAVFIYLASVKIFQMNDQIKDLKQTVAKLQRSKKT